MCREALSGKRCFQATSLSAVVGGGVGPGQQLVELFEMAVDDLGEDVGEVGVRIDAVELAGLDQRGDDRPVLAAAVGAGEERVLAIEGNRADRSLDVLESISIRPSSRKRVRPSQRESA